METRTAAYSASAGRLLLSALFVISGISKLGAPAATKGYIAAAGLPFVDLAYIAAIVVEVGLGLALLVGYRTRLVGALMAAFTVVTAFAFHFNLADQNQFIHFMKNLSIAGGLLQVVAFGGGAFSLDARRARLQAA